MPWLNGTDDLVTVESYWPTYHEVDPASLLVLLASSRVQCEAFAPSLAVTDPVTGVVSYTDPPTNYLMAQAMQARALYRSGIAGSGDQIGADGLGVTVFPMDWTVKNLLRPRRIGRVL